MIDEISVSSFRTLLTLTAAGVKDDDQKKMRIQELLERFDRIQFDDRREVVGMIFDILISPPSGIYALKLPDDAQYLQEPQEGPAKRRETH